MSYSSWENLKYFKQEVDFAARLQNQADKAFCSATD